MTAINSAGSDRLAVYSAWLFLAGSERTAAADAALRALVARFGGFPNLVSFWAGHEGLPRRLAEAISALARISRLVPEFPAESVELYVAASEALWIDGDLDAAEVLLAELVSVIPAR